MRRNYSVVQHDLPAAHILTGASKKHVTFISSFKSGRLKPDERFPTLNRILSQPLSVRGNMCEATTVNFPRQNVAVYTVGREFHAVDCH